MQLAKDLETFEVSEGYFVSRFADNTSIAQLRLLYLNLLGAFIG